MKNLLFLAFCAAVYIILIHAQEKYARRYQFQFDNIPLPEFITPIPGKLHNYRSAQLTTDQLDSLLSLGIISTVIRLNGNGRDAGGVPIGTERQVCQAHNVEFLTINPAAAVAHISVHGLLLDGRALIHCLHGFDRTGAMVGFHLRQLGYTRDQVIQHNGWKNYVQKKGKAYQKYLAYIN